MVGLHLKGVLAGECSISRNWLALGGAVPPGFTRPQVIKASDTETRKCGYYVSTMHKSLAEESLGRSGLIIHVNKSRFGFVLFCLMMG